MKRLISSKLTFLYKFVLPCSVLFSMGAGAVAMLMSSKAPIGAFIFLLAFFIIFFTMMYLMLMRLKKVEMDDQYLYISNYFREVKVRREYIARVTENKWINIHPVTIHFKQPTDFGEKITFMPTVRLFAFFSPHPIVAELKATIQPGAIQ